MIEDKHGHSQIFIDLGHQVVRHQPRQLNTGMTNSVARKIKDSEFSAVVTEVPVSGVHVAPPRHHAAVHQLCTWATLCIAIDIPMVFIGTFCEKWKDPQLAALITGGQIHLAHHRMCHFGVKIDPTARMPSSSCVVTASTIKLKAHPCKCGNPRSNHSEDFKYQHSGAKSVLYDLKHQATISVGRCIFSETFQRSVGSTPDSTPPRVSTQAFPTEGRERQKIAEKKRKEAGIERKKKQFAVEEKFDDRGTDLSGLGSDVHAYAAYIIMQPSDDERSDDSQQCPEGGSIAGSAVPGDNKSCIVDNLDLFWLLGSDAPAGLPLQAENTYIASNIDEIMTMLTATTDADDGVEASSGVEAYALNVKQHKGTPWDSRIPAAYGVYVVELCGGEARTTTICVRKGLKSGGSFDIVTHCDLNDPHTHRQVERFFDVHEPLVVVSAPTCRPFGPRAHQNKVVNYDA